MPILIVMDEHEENYSQLLYNVAEPAAAIVEKLAQEVLELPGKDPDSEVSHQLAYAHCLAIQDRLDDMRRFLNKLIDQDEESEVERADVDK